MCVDRVPDGELGGGGEAGGPRIRGQTSIRRRRFDFDVETRVNIDVIFV